MTTPSTTTQTSPEREIQFKAIMANYRPPITLRTPHKKLLKTAWSIRQGYDGTKLECFFCHKLEDFGGITVHHQDNNEEHNDPDNLSPACWDCNRKEGNIVRLRKKAEVRERERETIRSGNYSASQEARPEILELNEEYETLYRRYMISHLLAYGRDPEPDDFHQLVRKNLHPAACEEVGCNPKTGYSYLARMVNPINGFIKEEPWRESGRRILIFRTPEYYNLETDEIEKLHPKAGLRMAVRQASKIAKGETAK